MDLQHAASRRCKERYALAKMLRYMSSYFEKTDFFPFCIVPNCQGCVSCDLYSRLTDIFDEFQYCKLSAVFCKHSASHTGGPQVKGLEGLSRTLFVEVMDLRRERARALVSRTAYGFLKNLLGYCLSAYCMIRCVCTSPSGLLPMRTRMPVHGIAATLTGVNVPCSCYCTSMFTARKLLSVRRSYLSTEGLMQASVCNSLIAAHRVQVHAANHATGCLLKGGLVRLLWVPWSRMYTSVRSLIFGEDLTSDPVSRTISFCLFFFSRGQIRMNVLHLSQVRCHWFGKECCPATYP
jgi:hypothetical protein